MPLVPSAIRQVTPQADLPNAEDVALDGDGDLGSLINPNGNVVVIDLPDGTVSINLAPLQNPTNAADADKHDENLAKHMADGEMATIAENLLRLIGDDIRRQDQRLVDIVKGIDLLGIKLEEPRTEPGEEGMSVVKHPLLLEAILRFQANARGELLPADGPVKVANEGDGTEEVDEEAMALEKDMNHYLTTGAPEYYPDTDRMFFSLGHGGEAYKKVYFHPIKRRPVSDTIDRKDLIMSEGAVSLEACGRVTHRSRMKPSDVKRMMLAKVWRDVGLGQSTLSDENPVDNKLSNISGVAPKTTIEPEELDREIYECYCEIDLRGFEHKEDGGETGLALPYRVTMDKDSRQVLEIRRWWEEGDESFTRKEVFVEYVFVPAFPGVNLGLLHILGNSTRALTAAWRIALDNGMLSNFPGGLVARSAGKQQTTNIRVSPGQLAPVDVEGVPLKDAIMPLPYRDVTPGFVAIIQQVEQTSQRVGGTAETSVGEGKQDAPVGTTIALIEQATKVLNAVHKRMHQAQGKEFGLLKALFKKDPKSIWRANKTPAFDQDVVRLTAALNDKDIVPRADPNCSSQSLRIQKAIAIYTLAKENPQYFDQATVYKRIFTMIGIEDGDSLFAKTPPQQQQDPSKQMMAQAALQTAQAKQQEVAIKAKMAQVDATNDSAEIQAKQAETKVKAVEADTESKNRAEDRQSDAQIEMMRLQREEVIHGQQMGHEQKVHQDKMDLERQKIAAKPTPGLGAAKQS